MANIFSLYGNIFIDNEKANKSIDETTEKGKKSSSSFAENLGKVAKTGAQVATAVVGTTTAVVTGLTAMATKSAKNSDEIDKMSQRLGMSKQGYQEWDYILSQAGVDINTMQTGMKSLVKNMDAVTEGNKTSIANFKKLGVSVTDSTGKLKSQEQMFQETVIALQNMEDGTEKARLAQELFGKQGQEMLPLLNGESGSIEELKNRAHELGMVMSDEAVDAGVSLVDTMDTLKRAGGGLFNSIAGSLVPVVEQFANLIIDNMPVIQSLVSQLAPILSQMLQSLLPPLMQLASSLLPVIINLINTLLPPITRIIEAILPIIIQLIEMLLPPIIQIVDMILPLLLSLIEPLLPLLEPILNLLQPFIDLLVLLLEPLTDLLNMVLPPLIQLFTTIIQMILPQLQNNLTIVSSVLTNVFGGAFNYIKDQVQVLKNVFQGIIDFVKNVFTGNWKGAWENVKNIFSNIASGLGNAFKYPINFIIDSINGFLRGLNKIKIPDWVPGVGGRGFNIGLIPKLRVGMEYVPYDEYPALLHKGEAVLTADENREYQSNKNKVVVEKNGFNKEDLVQAFKEAIQDLTGKVILDDDKVGDFVIEKVEGVVYG